jgi:N-acetylmuramic acid 6-phosphate etherase
MTPRIRYDRLPTERSDPRTRDLDRLSAVQVARLMNRADTRAVRAVGRAAPAIARAVDLIVDSLSGGGRLVFVGAGTSGRLGVIEAAECPPTFGTPPALVQAVLAGGRRAVFRAAEGAEDDAAEGARQVRRRLRPRDVVVGIAASGVTPFVRAALAEACRRGAATVLVACNPRVPRNAAGVVIGLAVGPEVLAGSTRLKAGTATKLTLNTLTTAAFARLGKVYGNRMVDLRPRSAKLRARAARLVSEIGRVRPRDAARLLRQGGGSVKLAIVMARLGVGAHEARLRLRRAAGSLRRLLDEGAPARGGRHRRVRMGDDGRARMTTRSTLQ